ncbi:MAG: biotin transporter BioY [Clostridiales bacterium]
MRAQSHSPFKTIELMYISLFAVIIALCAWISIPTAIPFTLQTFGVCLCAGLLKTKNAVMAVLVYILLGAVGAPVFAGFSGGMGILLSPLGGYIIGFLLSAVVIGLLRKVLGRKLPGLIIAMIAGLCCCYAVGTVWYMVVYAQNSGTIGLITALSWCVLPFIIPDLAKITAAALLVQRLQPYLKA